MKLREQKGFTLIEVIVVAGIIAVLAGILVPLIFKEIDESKISRAAADVRSISSAIIVLKKDTGQWPVSSTCLNTATIITGSGALPTLNDSWDASDQANYDSILNNDDNGCFAGTTVWKGPYMAHVTADPWGHAYVTNADAYRSTASPLPPIWIISAGPDGILQTRSMHTEVVSTSDDVGLRLR